MILWSLTSFEHHQSMPKPGSELSTLLALEGNQGNQAKNYASQDHEFNSVLHDV